VTLPQQSRCSVVYGRIPLLRVAVVASCPRRRQALRLDESFVARGAGAEHATHSFLFSEFVRSAYFSCRSLALKQGDRQTTVKSFSWGENQVEAKFENGIDPLI